MYITAQNYMDVQPKRRKPFPDVLKTGAREYLDPIAHDISAGATGLWDEAKRIERRFRVTGYTIRKVCQLDDSKRFNNAMDILECPRFELDELDRIRIGAALDALRDLRRVWGVRFGTLTSWQAGQKAERYLDGTLTPCR